MNLKVLAVAAILRRNPLIVDEQIRSIVVDCDGDSEGYFDPVFADPDEMRFREILSFFRYDPRARMARRFIKF